MYVYDFIKYISLCFWLIKPFFRAAKCSSLSEAGGVFLVWHKELFTLKSYPA